jgi:hypothetical protein
MRKRDHASDGQERDHQVILIAGRIARIGLAGHQVEAGGEAQQIPIERIDTGSIKVLPKTQGGQNAGIEQLMWRSIAPGFPEETVLWNLARGQVTQRPTRPVSETDGSQVAFGSSGNLQFVRRFMFKL